MTDVLGRILGNPWFWGRVWEKLPGLNPASPIDLAILDFYLLSDWLENRKGLMNSSPPLYYVDLRTLKSLLQGTPDRSVKGLFFGEVAALDKKPVFLLLEKLLPDHNWPLLLILNYEKKKALLLGTTETKEMFNNPPWFRVIWTRVADFFEWDCPSPASASILVQPWIPVGFSPYVWVGANEAVGTS
jgi:hypothetical protein